MRHGDIDLIGISGKATSGKDFLATNVLKPLGYRKVAFSWPLKLEAVKQGVGTFDEVFVTKPDEVRKWLIEFGMARREDDPEYWIKQLRSLLELLYHERGETQFCITDVRFLNEAALVRNLGGKLVRMWHGLDRPYALPLHMQIHKSENALDLFGGWDAEIRNHVHTTPRDMYLELMHREVVKPVAGTEFDARGANDD